MVSKDILIVPDVHNKIIRATQMRSIKCDYAIWLGDFFDDFGDNPAIASETAYWLKELMDSTQDIFILGNHDAQYLWPEVEGLKCSGYEVQKARAISAILQPLDKYRYRFKLSHQDYGFLFSHGGLHPSFELPDDQEVYHALSSTRSVPNIMSAGYIDGGRQLHGGINWLRWNEHEVGDGLNQIVGHTPLKKPGIKSNAFSNAHFNLDTHLKNYAILKVSPNGKGIIKIYGI